MEERGEGWKRTALCGAAFVVLAGTASLAFMIMRRRSRSVKVDSLGEEEEESFSTQQILEMLELAHALQSHNRFTESASILERIELFGRRVGALNEVEEIGKGAFSCYVRAGRLEQAYQTGMRRAGSLTDISHKIDLEAVLLEVAVIARLPIAKEHLERLQIEARALPSPKSGIFLARFEGEEAVYSGYQTNSPSRSGASEDFFSGEQLCRCIGHCEGRGEEELGDLQF